MKPILLEPVNEHQQPPAQSVVIQSQWQFFCPSSELCPECPFCAENTGMKRIWGIITMAHYGTRNAMGSPILPTAHKNVLENREIPPAFRFSTIHKYFIHSCLEKKSDQRSSGFIPNPLGTKRLESPVRTNRPQHSILIVLQNTISSGIAGEHPQNIGNACKNPFRR